MRYLELLIYLLPIIILLRVLLKVIIIFSNYLMICFLRIINKILKNDKITLKEPTLISRIWFELSRTNYNNISDKRVKIDLYRMFMFRKHYMFKEKVIIDTSNINYDDLLYYYHLSIYLEELSRKTKVDFVIENQTNSEDFKLYKIYQNKKNILIEELKSLKSEHIFDS